MPSDVSVPPAAASVAERYRRIERPTSGGVALLAGVAVAAAFVRLSIVPAVAVAVVVLAVARVPLLRSDGHARLRTDAALDAVRADFEGLCPPPLALQWGVADAVRPTENGATYEVSYLFGLRSVDIDVDVRPADDDVELVVTADGRPWATYSAAFEERDRGTVVTVESASDRRFGLRRLPQFFVAERYVEAALSAQGYTVVERDVSLGR
jgi:hypothetical protein